MTGRRLGRWVVSQGRLRYDWGHDHDTVGCACDTAGEAATQRASAHVGGGGGGGRGCDTAQGTARDTAGPGLRHGAVCAQAGPRVGALCTRLGFDSMHCSESLFGKLFMNTVHEHCS